MVMVAGVEVESPACTRSGPLPPPQGGGAARLQPREWAGRPRGKNCRNVMQLPTLSVTNIHRTNKGRKCFVTGINQASQATRNTRKLGTQPNKAIKRPHPSPHLCMWTPYERCVTVGLNGVDRCVGKCMCSRGQGLNSCPGSRVAGHAPEPNGRA